MPIAVDFASAVQLLVEAHKRELHDAHNQLSPYYAHSMLSSHCRSGSLQSVASSSLVVDEGSAFRTPVESYNKPLTAPEIVPAWSPVGSLEHIGSSKDITLPDVPRTPRTPVTPIELPQVAPRRENSTSSSDALGSKVHLSTCSGNIISKTSLFSKGSNQSTPNTEMAHGDCPRQHFSQTSVKFASDDTTGHDAGQSGTVSLTPMFLTQCERLSEETRIEVARRWQYLADALTCAAAVNLKLLPGWILESASSEAETSCFMHRSTLVSNLTETQKTAIRKFEAKTSRLCSDSFLVHMPMRASSSRQLGISFLLSMDPSLSGRSRGRWHWSDRTSRIIAHPAARSRRLWFVLSLMVIVYEVFSITMQPFGFLEGTVFTVIEWITAIFWSLDIILNFFTGFYRDGKVEMRFKIISKQYLRTWFPFDLIVVAAQYVSFLAKNENLSAALVLRVLRCMRSLRLVKVFYWLKDELGLSSSVITGSKICQFLGCLGFFVHCSGCLWFEIGKQKNGWVHAYDGRMDDSTIQDYLISLHWALSQLQGNTDVYPGKSFGDRIFVVISSFSSIVALGAFVSSMTETLVSARQHRKRKTEETDTLHGFFARHEIDPEIRARADHYLQLREKQNHAMAYHVQDQQALELFPASLRALLMTEMRSFAVTWHPAFAYAFKFHKSVFVRAVSTAVSENTYAPGDDVFTVGIMTNAAYFIRSGDFVLNATFDVLSTLAPWLTKDEEIRSALEKKYGRTKSNLTNHPDTVVSGDSSRDMQWLVSSSVDRFVHHHRPVQRMAKGQVVSEISLWVEWTHAGDLCAIDHGKCLGISAMKVIDALVNHPGLHAIFASFALRFAAVAKYLRQHGSTSQNLELMSILTVMETEEAWKQEYKPKASTRTTQSNGNGVDNRNRQSKRWSRFSRYSG